MKLNFYRLFCRTALAAVIALLAFLSVRALRHVQADAAAKPNSFKKTPVIGVGAASSAPVNEAIRTNQELSFDTIRLNTNKFPSISEIGSSLKYNQDRIVDEAGNGVSLSPDRQSVVITARNGDLILKTNVIVALLSLFQVKSADSFPVVGDKKLGSVQLINGYLFVTVGNMVVNINRKNGQVRPAYED